MKTKQKTTNYFIKRRAVRIFVLAAFFLIPFINIAGKPLLRLDIYAQNLYFFGMELLAEHIFFGLLIVFSLIFFFIFFTQVFGRIWCGWLCPQTVLIEFLPDRGKIGVKRKPAQKLVYIILALILAVLVTFGAASYFMSPSLVFQKAISFTIHPFWVVLALIIFAELAFIGRRFCRSVCPYSMFQSVMYDKDTIRVAFNNERQQDCIKCKACVRACPTGLDIREGLNNKCICCAACVDACSKVLAKLNKTTIVDYYFGERKAKLFRVNRVISFSLGLVFAVVAFIYIQGRGAVYFDAVETFSGTVVTARNTYKDNVYISFSTADKSLSLASGEAKTIVINTQNINSNDITATIVYNKQVFNKSIKVKPSKE